VLRDEYFGELIFHTKQQRLISDIKWMQGMQEKLREREEEKKKREQERKERIEKIQKEKEERIRQ